MLKRRTSIRKTQHIDIVLNQNVEPTISSFEKYHLSYKALPELNLSDIDTSISFFNKKLAIPFLISSMTGGTKRAAKINSNLAIAAEKFGVAMSLGSMRIIFEKPEAIESFSVRHLCPSIPLFANIGLVQLNYGYDHTHINRLIDAVDADGIFFHINHLQEAIQPEGDTNFSGLLNKLEKILPKIKKPILIKEVGNGIDKETSKQLSNIGVKWIDVSGTGGTSWPLVEGYRRNNNLGQLFQDVGIPTDVALKDSRNIKGLNLIAGGGVRNGIHIATSIALGAKLATAAKPLLVPALKDSQSCMALLKRFETELKIAMFVAGVKDLKQLSKIKLTSLK